MPDSVEKRIDKLRDGARMWLAPGAFGEMLWLIINLRTAYAALKEIAEMDYLCTSGEKCNPISRTCVEESELHEAAVAALAEIRAAESEDGNGET